MRSDVYPARYGTCEAVPIAIPIAYAKYDFFYLKKVDVPGSTSTKFSSSSTYRYPGTAAREAAS